jgi:hypothetical protein
VWLTEHQIERKRGEFMIKRAGVASLLALVLLTILAFGSTAVPSGYGTSQNDQKSKQSKRDKKKDKESESARATKPLLWVDPTDLETRDLFYGAGGAEGAPDPNGKFTFVRRSTAGTSKKYIVEDDKGRGWTVKLGPEARPETTASRIVWAVGYHTDQDYFVKKAHVSNEKDGFDVKDVRFERRNDGYEDIGLWSWEANPFMGRREFQGLKVLMALLNNWDLKTDNNKILRPKKKSGEDRDLRIYYVSDLGASLGSTGSFWRKLPGLGEAPAGSKGKPKGYARQEFIKGVENGIVVFNYKGKLHEALEGISADDARWMGHQLSRLSQKQLTDALRAGGFSDSEIGTYLEAITDRIDQLKKL